PRESFGLLDCSWVWKQLQALDESEVFLIVRDEWHFHDQGCCGNQTIRNKQAMAQSINPQQFNCLVRNQVTYLYNRELFQEFVELSQLSSTPTAHHQFHLRNHAYGK